MKDLIVGPGLCDSPVSEGRRKFVLELSSRLKDTFELDFLNNSAEADESVYQPRGVLRGPMATWAEFIRFHRRLESAVTRKRPGLVCHFPYGSFHGIRGLINIYSMNFVDRMCASHGVRCLTLLYSITKASRRTLARFVRELVLQPSPEWTGLTMRMGIDLVESTEGTHRSSAKPSILFMSGAGKGPIFSPFKYVLNERGLEEIVNIAHFLASNDIRVIVAVPLLDDLKTKEKVKNLFKEKAPALDLELRTFVSVPQIFGEADLFIFPYKRELTQFVPTSILESMAAGVPVVIPKTKMLSCFYTEVPVCYLYEPCNIAQLGETIVRAIADEKGRALLAQKAKDYVKANWSIEQSVEDLRRIQNS